ncbi:NlpC/P60 family protein [Parvularcula marina]|uniref:C40 family peptidase n=1 Tax=Parvularcula marina TaxID=2292771 RepID=UPI003510FD78
MSSHRIALPHSLALAAPEDGAEAVSDFLFGERVVKLEQSSGYVRVRNEYDSYEGWIPEAALGPDTAPAGLPPFRVRARLAGAYHRPACELAMEGIGVGSPIYPVARIDGWIKDAGGLWFREDDVAAVPAKLDRVDVALEFIGVPYVWGGRYGGGIDCSGLVQIGAMLNGLDCERDTKDQVSSFGEKLGGLEAPGLQRGDVLYVPGHVAILTGPDEAVHADGKAGHVHVQKIEEIVANRGFKPEDVTIRRPAA